VAGRLADCLCIWSPVVVESSQTVLQLMTDDERARVTRLPQDMLGELLLGRAQHQYKDAGEWKLARDQVRDLVHPLLTLVCEREKLTIAAAAARLAREWLAIPRVTISETGDFEHGFKQESRLDYLHKRSAGKLFAAKHTSWSDDPCLLSLQVLQHVLDQAYRYNLRPTPTHSLRQLVRARNAKSKRHAQTTLVHRDSTRLLAAILLVSSPKPTPADLSVALHLCAKGILSDSSRRSDTQLVPDWALYGWSYPCMRPDIESKQADCKATTNALARTFNAYLSLATEVPFFAPQLADLRALAKQTGAGAPRPIRAKCLGNSYAVVGCTARHLVTVRASENAGERTDAETDEAAFRCGPGRPLAWNVFAWSEDDGVWQSLTEPERTLPIEPLVRKTLGIPRIQRLVLTLRMMPDACSSPNTPILDILAQYMDE
jgi:hypothetical protein